MSEHLRGKAVGLKVYVAHGGDDTHSGLNAKSTSASSKDGPVATLERALAIVRTARLSAAGIRGSAWISVEPGDYAREASLEITSADSGTPDAPLVIAGSGDAPGNAKLIGGKAVSGWRKVSDSAVLDRLDPLVRSAVRVCDLRSQGVTDFGSLGPRGHTPRDDAKVPLELFHRGRVMELARWPDASPWPNGGYTQSTQVASGIGFSGDRPLKWKQPQHAWLFGYWGNDWHFVSVPARGVNAAARCFTTEDTHGPSNRYFVANVLEELDQPGEYYVDREAGLLYFLPPSEIRHGDTVVSTLAAPLVVTKGVSNVVFERIGFETTRGGAAVLNDSRQVTFLGCTFRNIGLDGVVINRGGGHRIVSCDFEAIGDTGIAINAGDRKNLVPADVTIHNNRFHEISRVARTYHGAVNGDYGGYIGATISRNQISDICHTAIFFWGNDIHIRGNELYNVVLENDDSGAVYTGRDWTFQGNTFHDNFLHHTGSSGRHDFGTMGLYHDDGAGGTDARRNIFWHVSKPAFAGGGVNTVFENNLFVDCHPVYWADERGLSTGDAGPNTMVGGFMKDRFYGVGADSDAWLKRYPALRVVHENYKLGKGTPPLGNAFRRNVLWRVPEKWMISPWVTVPDHVKIENNLIHQAPGFVDEAWGDFRLLADAAALKLGFTAMAPRAWGLEKDAYRRVIERVESKLEVVTPVTVGMKGASGRVRLTLRNVGDTVVEDVELLHAFGVVPVTNAGYMLGRAKGEAKAIGGVDFGAGRKTLDSIARTATIAGGGEWRFRVAPGESVSREFDVELTAEAAREYSLLQVDTRGKRALPARLRTELVFPISSALTLDERVTISADGKSSIGRIRLALGNRGTARSDDNVSFRVEPAGVIELTEEGSSKVRLEAGERTSIERGLRVGSGLTMGDPSVALVAEGQVMRETRLTVPIERALPLVKDVKGLGGLSPFPVFTDWRRRAEPGAAPFATITFGIVGDRLALVARVNDPKIGVTPDLWTGSCLEIFGSMPGAAKIGQVFLVPAHEGRPARGFVQSGNDAVAAAEIDVSSITTAEGYVLTATIPLTLLTLDSRAERVRLEAAVTTGFDGKLGARRGTIFGSTKAYAENERFGWFVRMSRP